MRFVPFAAAAGGGTAVILAAAAVFAPQFRAEEILVTGGSDPIRAEVQTISKELVRAESFLAGHPRLLLVRTDRLAGELKRRLPSLLTVRVSRSLPRTVAIAISEKVPLAFLATPQGFFAVDSGGAILRPVPPDEVESAGLPIVHLERFGEVVSIGSVVIEQDLLERLHDVVVLLPERLGVSVVNLILPSAGSEEIHVRTDRGELLLFDTRRPLADQLRILEHAMAEEIPPSEVERLGVVDLRIPGKVFYSLRPHGRAVPSNQ